MSIDIDSWVAREFFDGGFFVGTFFIGYSEQKMFLQKCTDEELSTKNIPSEE
jgi:hypothetical protein